jgi:hypothetical protein
MACYQVTERVTRGRHNGLGPREMRPAVTTLGLLGERACRPHWPADTGMWSGSTRISAAVANAEDLVSGTTMDLCSGAGLLGIGDPTCRRGHDAMFVDVGPLRYPKKGVAELLAHSRIR